MKDIKKLALIIAPVIIILAFAGFFIVKAVKKTDEAPAEQPQDTNLIETSLADSPFISLTPTSDGHWLNLKVLNIKDADELEYELLYENEDGATQGSIGSVDLKENSYEKKILLGSESSGHYRYDEGVKKGTLTIRLRGGIGRRKYSSDFHIQKGDDELVSIDQSFSITGTVPATNYYITMNTIGAPEVFEESDIETVYGVFSSGSETLKNATLSFENQENKNLQVFALESNAWKEIKSENKEGILSAEISSTGVYLFSSNPEQIVE